MIKKSLDKFREMEFIESASVTFFYSSQVRTPKMHFIACIILETNKKNFKIVNRLDYYI